MQVPAEGNVTVTFSPVFPAVTPPDVPTGLFLTLMSHDVAKYVFACFLMTDGLHSETCSRGHGARRPDQFEHEGALILQYNAFLCTLGM